MIDEVKRDVKQPELPDLNNDIKILDVLKWHI